MIKYLTEEEIVKINELSLTKNEIFCYEQPKYVKFTLDFVKNKFDNDLYKKALAYCISLVVHHAFKEGNHRTSLYSSQIFLIKNNFKQLATPESVNQIQEWRINELIKSDHSLEREFFRVAGTENKKIKEKEIEKIMNSEYSVYIEKWLKESYKIEKKI